MDTLFTFVLNIVVITAQIVDRKEFYAGDSFTATCDIAKFSGAPFNDVNMLALQRKTSTNSQYVDIAVYLPYSPNVTEQTTKYIPPGNSWDIQFSGGAGTGNRNTIKIVLVSKNSSCNDAGLYRCAADFVKGMSPLNTLDFNLTALAPIIQNDILMAPHIKREGGDAYTSYNQVGENIKMTCSYTGPLNLQTVWRYTTQGSTFKQIYPYTNDITELVPQIVFPLSRCNSYDYTSVLAFEFQQMDDGNIYYCIAMSDSSERSIRNFTIKTGTALILPADATVSSTYFSFDLKSFGVGLGAMACVSAVIIIILVYCLKCRNKTTKQQEIKVYNIPNTFSDYTQSYDMVVKTENPSKVQTNPVSMVQTSRENNEDKTSVYEYINDL